MTPRAAVLAMTALIVLFVGALAAQRCSYDRLLAQQHEQATKADRQLVTATQELATEHVETAKAQATAKRAAAAQRVHQEVADATSGDRDLAAWINQRIGGD